MLVKLSAATVALIWRFDSGFGELYLLNPRNIDYFQLYRTELQQLYIDFINNYDAMMEMIVRAEQRHEFQSFIANIYTGLRGPINGTGGDKRRLRDLVIQPVQRLPRYLTLIQQLIKHTSEDHCDHAELLRAERETALLVERIDRGKAEAETMQLNRKLLSYIERAFEDTDFFHDELSNEEAQNLRFLRSDHIVAPNVSAQKRERSEKVLWLFNNLIVITIPRRNKPAKEQLPIEIQRKYPFIDLNCRHKVWRFFPIQGKTIECSPKIMA